MNRITSFVNKYVDPFVLLPLLGALLIIPLGVNAGNYMGGRDFNQLDVPLWLSFVSGSLSLLLAIGSICFFLFKNKSKRDLFFLSIAIVLIIINTITTFIEPETIVAKGWVYPYTSTSYIYVDITFFNETKYIFPLMFGAIILYIYIFIFIVPKLIRDVKMIQFGIYVMYIFFLITIIYSLFVETYKYVDYFKSIFDSKGSPEELSNNALVSFFGHRNVYARFLMMVICLSLVNYQLDKRFFNIVITGFTSIYLLFTYSKSAILTIYSLLLVVTYIWLIYSLTKATKKQKYVILLISISIFLLIAFMCILLLYLFNDTFNSIISNFVNAMSVYNRRKLVWGIVWDNVNPNWLFSGRGYGVGSIIVSTLTPLTLGETLPNEHSAIFSMIDKGGFVLLFSFVALLIYSIVRLTSLFRKKFLISLFLSFGFLSFLINAFGENSYYMLFVITLVTNALLFCNAKEVDEK